MTSTIMAPDRFNRFYTAAHYLRTVCSTNVTASRILDLGSNENKLAEFLDGVRVIQSDIDRTDCKGCFVQGRAEQTPFPDQSIDYVTCLDVLEHNPRPVRSQIIREIGRITSDTAIIAFPADHPINTANERLLSEIYQSIHGTSNRFLDEHREFGLVNTKITLEELSRQFRYTHVLYSFPCQIWLMAHLIDCFLGILPNTQPIRNTLFSCINQLPISIQTETDAYRTFIFASHTPLKPVGFDLTANSQPPCIDPDIVDSFSRSHKNLQDLHLYATDLEANLRSVSEAFQSLETHYKNTKTDLDNHVLLRKSLENSIDDLKLEITQLKDEVSRHRQTSQEYEKLEQYSLHLEKTITEKDRLITDLQAKLTHFFTQNLNRNNFL